jgi:hypothetical protein
MLIIRYQINEINETVHEQEIRTFEPRPNRARCPRRGCPYLGYYAPTAGVRVREGLGHRGG